MHENTQIQTYEDFVCQNATAFAASASPSNPSKDMCTDHTAPSYWMDSEEVPEESNQPKFDQEGSWTRDPELNDSAEAAAFLASMSGIKE